MTCLGGSIDMPKTQQPTERRMIGGGIEISGKHAMLSTWHGYR